MIYADQSGDAYSISIPEGRFSHLASMVGFASGIAADANHILFSSGTKVLFYARSDNHGENPPDTIKGARGGWLTGVSVDSSDAAWIIDHDHSSISGPFSLR